MGTGVMGLMNSRGSVASQFQSQFSYCIGDLRDSNHSFNTLALGYDAVLEGMWTPILNYSSKVYVRLQKILVAGEALDIDPIVFEGSIYGGGTVLDSGAPLSYLTDEAYRKLRAKVNESIADNTAGKSDLSTLCRDDLEEYEVPFVRFVFDRGAELFLGFSSLFHRASPRKHCMSVRSSSSVGLDEKLSLIGLYAQQLHNVGYDYNNGRVYFWESGCVR
uniref:Peptidase A1 domain-containing protein n=1 Tax=Kalanchoe fedtschenkoi TaxID=63787 RepID=A0A7N0UTX7_KALFE